jgi:hypothetical protein
MLGRGSLQVVLGYLQTHWRAVSLAALLAAATVIWYVAPPAETYGVIHVDSPQVYTRERLVNDRFTEEAWLRQQLERTQQLLDNRRFDAPEARINRNLEAFVDLLLTAKGPGAPDDSGDEQEDTSALEWPAALQTYQDLAQDPGIEQDPADTFARARNYRDAIRADLLQTQLDDRHDIGGNTLYRLTFDASVLPGRNTHRAAQILITLAPLSDENSDIGDPSEDGNGNADGMLESELPSDDASDAGDPDEDGHGNSNGILESAYRSLYLDWQKHLQLTVANAIDAQTDMLLGSGTLTGIDGLALQEFVVSQLMDALKGIESIDGFQHAKDREQSAQQQHRDASRQEDLSALIFDFKTAYEEKLRHNEAV